jgi:hypothetical protein
VYKGTTIKTTTQQEQEEKMLNVNQKIELLERTLESVHYNLENDKNGDIEEIIYEATDQFVPIFKNQIVEEWLAMGQPEPQDYELDPKDTNIIYTLIITAIVETARDYLYEVIPDLEADWDTHAETLRAELEHLGKARGYATLAKAIIE